MASPSFPWDNDPNCPPSMPAPAYPNGQVPAMPPVLGNPASAYPHGPWNAESEAKLIAARKSVSELEKVKQQAIDRVAASLSPVLGVGSNWALLVANAKRVRAALEQFDHDV